MTDFASAPLQVPEWVVDELSIRGHGDGGIRADMEHLGLAELVGAERTRHHEFVAIIDRLLSEVDGDAGERARAHLDATHGPEGSHDRLMVDLVTARALDDSGTSVTAVAMLMRVHFDLVLRSAEGVVRVDVNDHQEDGRPGVEALTVQVPLGNGMTWDGGCIEGIGDLPEVLATTIVGMPLDGIVSHPLLDAFPLTILGWDGRTLLTDVSMHMRPVFA